MLLADFLGWWYSRGWAWAANQFFQVYTHRVARFFSITDLFKTLFAPFRQDVINTKNAPLGYKLQVLGGNIVSRFFGFIIRSVLILVGFISVAACLVVGVVGVIVWPLLPVSVVVVPLIMAVVE